MLDERAIRSSEDAFIDRLYGTAPSHGAPLLAAAAPRAFVDLNRGAEELDPALIRGIRKPGGHNPRVASGLGVIPRVVSGGREIYRGKLTLGEAQGRLNDVWYPYHAALQQLLDQSRALFGEAILIDEALTPDSSRFWPADRYEPGRDQPSFDKQPLRDHLAASGWNKQPPPPPLPDDVVAATSERYAEAYRVITGDSLPD